jgi:hypothetical protein
MGGGERTEQSDGLRARRAGLGVIDDKLLTGGGTDVEGLHAQSQLADLVVSS